MFSIFILGNARFFCLLIINNASSKKVKNNEFLFDTFFIIIIIKTCWQNGFHWLSLAIRPFRWLHLVSLLAGNQCPLMNVSFYLLAYTVGVYKRILLMHFVLTYPAVLCMFYFDSFLRWEVSGRTAIVL